MGQKFKAFTSVSLIMAMLLSMSSCKAEQKTFPELSYPEETTASSESVTNTTVTPSDITDNVYDISMAVPYSQSTMTRLLKLFYLKKSDSMPDGSSGADIDLDYLDSINAPWSVYVINTPNEGVSVSAVDSWYSSGSAPDLFLINDIDGAIENNYVQPLGNYIYDYDMSSLGIYGNALSYCMSENGAYGIPLYQSFMMLYGNKDYVTEEGSLSFRCTFTEFHKYLTEINNQFNEEEVTVVPLARGYEFIPYLTNGSYMLMDEYTDPDGDSLKVKEMLAQDLTFVNDLYERGLTYDAALDGSDPTVTRQCALWIDSSSDMVRWNEYYPDSVYYSMIPNANDSETLTLYASVYALCLSKSSSQKAFASEFATFMCLDTDALMLLTRLEPHVGYYPVCDSDSLWEMICDDEEYGSVALMLRQNIENSYYCPNTGSSLEQKINDYCAGYVSHYGDTEENSEEKAPVFNLDDLIK